MGGGARVRTEPHATIELGGGDSSRNYAPVDCVDVSTVLEQNRNRPGVALPARDYHTTLREPLRQEVIGDGRVQWRAVSP